MSTPLVYDPYDYAFQEDPYPVYARLRNEEPLHHNVEHDFWAISRHEDIQHAIRTEGVYSNAMGVSLDESAWSPHAHKMMSFLAMDPPRQTRLRSLVSKGFTPRRVRELEPQVQRLTDRYLDSALADGSFDWIADVAGRLPMDVISELMGVPEADRDEVRRLADVVVHREDGMRDVPQAGMDAALTLVGYYADMLAERRRRPTDDLTSALLDADIEGDRMSDEEIIGFLFLMVVAGNETTTKLLGNAVFHLTRHPEQLQQVLDDRSLVVPWIEETLRFDTSSQALARHLLQDVELHGKVAPAGAKLLVVLGAANRDERVFTRPDEFDLHRDPAELRQVAQLRRRAALLPGRQPGPARGAGRARGAGPPGRQPRGRPRPLGPGALLQCPRLRGDPDDGGTPMSRYAQPDRRPAVVTGASSGIGAVTALTLAAAGHPVALGARRTDRLEEIATQIRAAGGEASVHPLDLTDTDSVEAFAAQVTRDLGEIEVVVSNAGAVAPGTIHEVDSERFAREIDLNLIGAHRLVHAFVPGLVERRRGDVVFVSSDVAVRARPHVSSYAAGKWGLEGMVHAMQMELEGTGVRASLVRPGPTWSEMGSDWDDEAAGHVLTQWVRFGHARHPHFLKPQAIADAIATVVSAPRGTHLNLIEVTPEAPLEDR